jgi:hypothetical protein
MTTSNPFPWGRIPETLEATPEILRHLLRGVGDAEADFRPDPVRLTIREIVTHLANWEAIAGAHLRRIRDENSPLLDQTDGGSPIPDARDRGTTEAVDRFAATRAGTAAFLRGLATGDWALPAIREVYGPTTMDAQATMLMMHDVYHIRQIVEWRQIYAARG